jgi:hypothetical protein
MRTYERPTLQRVGSFRKMTTGGSLGSFFDGSWIRLRIL